MKRLAIPVLETAGQMLIPKPFLLSTLRPPPFLTTVYSFKCAFSPVISFGNVQPESVGASVQNER